MMYFANTIQFNELIVNVLKLIEKENESNIEIGIKQEAVF